MFSTPACGGSDDARMQATLTDDGCAYEGDTKLAAGSFQIDVKNQTQHAASFAFAPLANGFTVATIKPILAKETAWGRSLTKNELRDILEGKLPLRNPRPDLPQMFDFGRAGSARSSGLGKVASCQASVPRPVPMPSSVASTCWATSSSGSSTWHRRSM